MYRNSEYVITKLRDPSGLAKPAQIGVDLTVKRILKIRGATVIPRNGKTMLGGYGEVKWSEPDGGTIYLEPGMAYGVEFDQGLKALSEDETAFIVQRSSLNRSGVQLQGSVYDPGFETDTLGATIYVYVPIVVEKHARLAQLLITTSEAVKVSQLYSGQFQGKGVWESEDVSLY